MASRSSNSRKFEGNMALGSISRWLALAVFAWLVTPSQADDLAGKTITYIVSTKPGGGYDTYGRLIAKYLEKHLSGTTVVVKNVPGAGQLAGAQLVYASPPDGLTIGLFNMGLIYGQIAGAYSDRLDLAKLSWIGKADSESRVIMVRQDSPFKSAVELSNTKDALKIAVNGRGTASHVESALIAKLLGWNLKPIFGYEGTEGELAVLRGDVDLMIGSRSSLQHYVDSHDARFLLSYGGDKVDDVPMFDRQTLTPGNIAAFTLFDSVSKFARATAGPPGLSAETLSTLRQAYAAALADPDLLKEAKQANLSIEPADGEAVQQALSSALNQTPNVKALIKAIVVQE
jgi:tripartite-type tricarboxylate transporter receptor subunit TctC